MLWHDDDSLLNRGSSADLIHYSKHCGAVPGVATYPRLVSEAKSLAADKEFLLRHAET